MNPDLTGYVTQKALDGLFLMIEKEELKIRQDPGARLQISFKRYLPITMRINKVCITCGKIMV